MSGITGIQGAIEPGHSTTLFTFIFQTPPSVRSVELLGSWDNFTTPYAMERDDRRGFGSWKGCYRFCDIICDGDVAAVGEKRSGALKMGGTYWYFFRLDGDAEEYDLSQPSTTSCPLLPGQPMNVLEVPFEDQSRTRAESLSLSTSLGEAQVHTLNPHDRYLSPAGPSSPELNQCEVPWLAPHGNINVPWPSSTSTLCSAGTANSHSTNFPDVGESIPVNHMTSFIPSLSQLKSKLMPLSKAEIRNRRKTYPFMSSLKITKPMGFTHIRNTISRQTDASFSAPKNIIIDKLRDQFSPLGSNPVVPESDTIDTATRDRSVSAPVLFEMQCAPIDQISCNRQNGPVSSGSGSINQTSNIMSSHPTESAHSSHARIPVRYDSSGFLTDQEGSQLQPLPRYLALPDLHLELPELLPSLDQSHSPTGPIDFYLENGLTGPDDDQSPTSPDQPLHSPFRSYFEAALSPGFISQTPWINPGTPNSPHLEGSYGFHSPTYTSRQGSDGVLFDREGPESDDPNDILASSLLQTQSLDNMNTHSEPRYTENHKAICTELFQIPYPADMLLNSVNSVEPNRRVPSQPCAGLSPIRLASGAIKNTLQADEVVIADSSITQLNKLIDEFLYLGDAVR